MQPSVKESSDDPRPNRGQYRFDASLFTREEQHDRYRTSTTWALTNAPLVVMGLATDLLRKQRNIRHRNSTPELPFKRPTMPRRRSIDQAHDGGALRRNPRPADYRSHWHRPPMDLKTASKSLFLILSPSFFPIPGSADHRGRTSTAQTTRKRPKIVLARLPN